MGDWNSVVGDESYRNIVGPHGLGRKNHRGQMLINFCERNGLIVANTRFKKPKRTVHMEGTRRSELMSVGLHTCETLIQKQCEGCADIDSDHNLLVAKICTRLKKIIRLQKRRPQLDFEKLYAQRQRVQNTLEEILGAIGCDSGNVEVQWNNIKECVC